MSGLVGSAAQAFNGQDGWIASAVHLLRRRPALEPERWTSNPLRVAYAGLGAGDALETAQTGPGTLFVVGDICNLSDVLSAFGAPGAAGGARTRAATLLDLYLRHGLRPLGALDGAFVLGVYDARDGRLRLMADRLGLRKLYYARSGAALLFGSEVKALLAHAGVSRTLDQESLEHFLSLGYLLDDHTWYEAIRLLPGGTTLTYAPDGGSLSVERSWVPQYATRANTRSLAECVDEYMARVEAAVRRRVQSCVRLTVPISGGLDSRMMLGIARRFKSATAFHTYSAGHGHSFDVVFGRRLARLCGVPHTFLPLPEDFLLRWSESFVWLTDGMITAHNCWGLGLRAAAEADADPVLSGFFGDVLTEIKKVILPFADAESVAAQLPRLHRYVCSEDDVRALLQPRLYRRVQGASERVYQRAVREARADDARDRERLVNVLQRQQRSTSFQLAVYGSVVPVSAPFADHEVTDFLLTVPWKYRVNRQIQKALICRHLPHLAGVPNESNGGLPLNAGRFRRALYWRWERLAKVQVPRWTGGRIVQHDRKAYAHYGEWMRREPVRTYLRRTFAEGEPYLAEWFEIPAIRRLLDRHLEGPADLYRQVSAVLTLILWFKQADVRRPAALEPLATPERS